MLKKGLPAQSQIRRLVQLSVIALLFVLSVAAVAEAGLAGRPAQVNFASLATWTIWWAALIFAILLVGKIWCLVCPWDLIASMM